MKTTIGKSENQTRTRQRFNYYLWTIETFQMFFKYWRTVRIMYWFQTRIKLIRDATTAWTGKGNKILCRPGGGVYRTQLRGLKWARGGGCLDGNWYYFACLESNFNSVLSFSRHICVVNLWSIFFLVFCLLVGEGDKNSLVFYGLILRRLGRTHTLTKLFEGFGVISKLVQRTFILSTMVKKMFSILETYHFRDIEYWILKPFGKKNVKFDILTLTM